jgi:thiamine biosynthesis lipoprotein
MTGTITRSVWKKAMKLMGNRFEISVVSEDRGWADMRIDAAVEEIRRIERLLTTYNDASETSLINANAGLQPVRVSEETFSLIARSLRLSRLTQGAFDISYGSVDKKLWNFDTTMTSLPDPATARKMVRLIDWRNIILDKEAGTVFLKEAGMRIGFGGIGKGYAAEMAKSLLKTMGVDSGIVNASGDLAVWGRQPNGRPWTIGIVHPDSAGQPFSYLELGEMAIATSGNYEKFVMVGGKKYSHTIDPRTGLPVSGIKSVTIICPNAELADAMATPVMIMGIGPALDMINQMKDIECILIDDLNRIHTSENINLRS